MAHRKRPNRLSSHVSPIHLFLTGIVVIACFLFQQNLIVRISQVLAFAGIAVLAGKRIRFGYFLIMVTSITFFNLLTPVGEVLLKAGPLVVTRGALRQGLMKGFAIPGLVFISLFAVRSDLQLPGRLGGLIARLFFYFEQLLDGQKQIRLRRFVDSVDELLMELLQSGPATDVASSPAVRTSRLGYLFVSILATSSIAVVVLFGAF